MECAGAHTDGDDIVADEVQGSERTYPQQTFPQDSA